MENETEEKAKDKPRFERCKECGLKIRGVNHNKGLHHINCKAKKEKMLSK